MNYNLEPAAAGNPFIAAVQWLSGTLLGSLATTTAVLAVASVGFLLLRGRIDVRRGAQVIFGCFVVFGASTIAGGIMSAVNGSGATVQMESAAAPPPAYPPAQPQVPAAAATAYDPYAGAAMPTSQ